MPYRLPLELELTILELAAPPLAIDRLPDRVDFFIKVSLIHRSLTAWAQDKLRDQFLYTYQPRPDEHERLKTRLEAGFGRDRPLRRLYLDLTRLPGDISGRTESGTDSVSATINGQVYRAVSTISGPSESKHFGTESSNQACESVANFAHPENTSPLAGYWRLCAMITNYSQALDTLWIWPPFYILDIKDLPPPRVLCIDDGVVGVPWNSLGTVPLSSETVLFLRRVGFHTGTDDGNFDTRQLVIDQCWPAETTLSDLLLHFHRLETLVITDTEDDDLVSTIVALPTSIRRVHINRCDAKVGDNLPVAPAILLHLESFTFELLLPSTGPPANGDPDALAEVQQAFESVVDAPQCTFNYLRSTKSRDEALAAAMAAFKLDL